jgi:hypothetical protein
VDDRVRIAFGVGSKKALEWFVVYRSPSWAATWLLILSVIIASKVLSQHSLQIGYALSQGSLSGYIGDEIRNARTWLTVTFLVVVED